MKKEVPTAKAIKKISTQEREIEGLNKLLTYYQEITNTIREPFVILDRKLCVVSANHAFYRTFKVLKIETEGNLIYKLGNDQWNSSELRELLQNILPKHRVFNNFEITHNFPGIGHKTMLLNARQIDSKQLILLAIEDVTKAKKLQADTEKMTASLVNQKTKLKELSDAKDEFISMASHQLRTPATIVKQYTTMLREGYAGALTKEQIEMLDSAIVSNERQLEIIEGLLRVARVDAGKVYLVKSDCDVKQYIEAIISGERVTLKSRKQSIVFKKPVGKVNAYIDTKLMRMVLENLLDNASKYSQDGKVLTIGLKQTKEQTSISICDTGVGIRKSDQGKLFQRFSRIENSMSFSTPGTGLGLYWVRKVVELHGGVVDVISRMNHGSLFTVILPTSVDAPDKKELLAVLI